MSKSRWEQIKESVDGYQHSFVQYFKNFYTSFNGEKIDPKVSIFQSILIKDFLKHHPDALNKKYLDVYKSEQDLVDTRIKVIATMINWDSVWQNPSAIDEAKLDFLTDKLILNYYEQEHRLQTDSVRLMKISYDEKIKNLTRSLSEDEIKEREEDIKAKDTEIKKL